MIMQGKVTKMGKEVKFSGQLFDRDFVGSWFGE